MKHLRLIHAVLTCLLAATDLSGCAQPQLARTDHISSPATGPQSGFEARNRIPPADDRRARSDKVTPALFWTGIALGIVGVVGVTTFVSLGVTTSREIDQGYSGGLTHMEFDDLEDRGALYNTLAKAAAGIGAIGFATSLIVYAVDWTRCGPLAPKRRRCPDSARARRQDSASVRRD